MTKYTAEGTSRTIDIDGINIHYHDLGSGVPVIMLHGGGPGASGWSNYNRNVDALAERYRLIIVDMPGYGKSSKPDMSDDPFGHRANALLRMSDALRLEKPHLIGNSLGGAVALRMALEASDKVGKVILMGPGGGVSPHQLTPTQGLLELLFYYAGGTPTRAKLASFLKHLVFDQSAITDELIDQRYKASIEADVLACPPLTIPKGPVRGIDLWRDQRLQFLGNEVLIIWCAEDKVNPADGALLFQRLIPRCDTYIFSKCGHWAQWEYADKFNGVVAAYLW
jgi:2-hydroxy-6-oxonona-2,4-dienedioate hydrolase/4,5:9,10-diseco-3-hydroxy-5,9,17-trioxoandrosta-1(10),2-diene-4-oate hydrolase